MGKIIINKKQELAIQRHFTEIISRLNNESENISYGCMNRIKTMITDREKILLEEEFSIK